MSFLISHFSFVLKEMHSGNGKSENGKSSWFSRETPAMANEKCQMIHGKSNLLSTTLLAAHDDDSFGR